MRTAARLVSPCGIVMPLHDWSDRSGWEGVHILWTTELLRHIKPQLPPEYRAYIGSAPVVAIGAPAGRPDVSVRQWAEQSADAESTAPVPHNPTGIPEPDEEVAVTALESETALYVETRGRLVAAVELVLPRNKDRPVAREIYLTRYLGYLLEGVHLLLVDVHRRPQGFSFVDRIAAELHLSNSACPAPFAVAYRVGESVPDGGRLLGIWRRPLAPGQPLPSLPLALTVEQSVLVDLEATYVRAADDAYLPT